MLGGGVIGQATLPDPGKSLETHDYALCLATSHAIGLSPDIFDVPSFFWKLCVFR
jgi:hypothetical protein